MSEHISLKICKSCGGILEMQRISRKAETHHPLDNRSLEGRCVKEDVPHIPKRLLSDCKLLCYFFFFFWMHSLQGLLLKGTMLVHHPMPLFPLLHIHCNWAVSTGALGRWIG